MNLCMCVYDLCVLRAYNRMGLQGQSHTNSGKHAMDYMSGASLGDHRKTTLWLGICKEDMWMR